MARTQVVQRYDATPGLTVRQQFTTSVAGSDMLLSSSAILINGKYAKSLLISVEDFACRFAFGTNPTTGVNGTGHAMAVGSFLELNNAEGIKDIRFIGLDGTSTLQITGEF